MSGSPPLRVLVLCTGNSARSQIAEALLATRGAGRVIAASAGTHPAPMVHPEAVAVLARHGIPWKGHEPRRLAQIEGERYDLVVTVGSQAAEACPHFPGAAAQVHWGLPDPAAEHDPMRARHAFESAYEVLAMRVERLLALPLESLAPAELARAAG
jgi:arsenate reductase